jgi:hypothetical protein
MRDVVWGQTMRSASQAGVHKARWAGLGFCTGNLKMNLNPKVEMYLLGKSMIKWTNNVPCTKKPKIIKK